jgi:hypothetical protein
MVRDEVFAIIYNVKEFVIVNKDSVSLFRIVSLLKKQSFLLQPNYPQTSIRWMQRIQVFTIARSADELVQLLAPVSEINY